MTVTLTAADAGPSGFSHFEHRAEGGSWQPLAGDTAIVDTNGVHLQEYRAVDVAGNAGPTVTDEINIDATAPSVACAAADPDWQAENVAMPCSAADAHSGLTDAADATFALSTTVAEGIETDAAETGLRVVCDTAGNRATAGPVLGHKIDRKSPTVELMTPADGEVYLLGQQVQASYPCADGGSGAAAVLWPTAPSSTPLQSAPRPSRCTPSTGSATWRPPLTTTRSSTISPASSPPWPTAPPSTRWLPELACPSSSASGATRASASWRRATPGRWKIECNPSAPPSDVTETLTTGSRGLAYDAVADQDVYRWKTDKTWPGACRRLVLKLLDGTRHEALFLFR